MYEVFKVLQGAAEKIGTVKNIAVHDGDRIWGDGVKIRGTTHDGYEFELSCTIEKKEAADDRD